MRKPPIVEMWVEFNFEPAQGNPLETVVAFLKEYEQNREFSGVEVLTEDQLEFQQMSPTSLPRVVGRQRNIRQIRVQGTGGARWLNLTPTQLVCNYLRLGDTYPGFTVLSADSLEKLARYVEICRPIKLQYVAIHYVDVIEIPVPDSGEICLPDYFTLGIDLPRTPFGPLLSYLVRTAVETPERTGPLEIQLQFEAIATERRAFRFRMDWHKVCPYDGGVVLDRIPSIMQGAHDSVMACFRAAFTDRTWALFEPEE